VLHSNASGIVYANRFFQPAFWTASEVEEDIDRITKQFNEVPKIQTMPRREGLPDAVMATWGGLKLEPISPESRAMLARGGSPNVGILVDFLGDFTLSVSSGLPVYKIGGTSGAVWIGSYDQSGRGTLRYLIADPEAMDELIQSRSERWTKGERVGRSGWIFSERYSGGHLDQCQVRGDVQAVNGTGAVMTVAILSKGTVAIIVEDDEWKRRIKSDWGWSEGQRFDNVIVTGNEAQAKARGLTMSNLQFAVFLAGDGLPQLRRLVGKEGMSIVVGGLTFKAWNLENFAVALAKLSECSLARN